MCIYKVEREIRRDGKEKVRGRGRQQTNEIEKASSSPLQMTEASREERTAHLVEQTHGRLYAPLMRLVQPFSRITNAMLRPANPKRPPKRTSNKKSKNLRANVQ